MEQKIKGYEMIVCDYGCGKEGIYYFPTVEKWCCSKSQNSCENLRKKHSIRMIGKNNPMFGKKREFTKEVIKKQSAGRKLTIEKLKKRYPFFTSVEEMRYNPSNPDEIQVRCKNHLCENSKEKEGWFSPTVSQIIERRRALEHPEGNDGRYFYCCEECKELCPLYNLKGDPQSKKEVYFTSKEYEIFREYVLKRDVYICQFCGDEATDVHHEKPQKLEPFFTLDPDYAWSCCEKCHYEKGHVDNCSTGRLASIVCS